MWSPNIISYLRICTHSSHVQDNFCDLPRKAGTGSVAGPPSNKTEAFGDHGTDRSTLRAMHGVETMNIALVEEQLH